MAVDLQLTASNARFTLGRLLDVLAAGPRVEVEAATTLAIATQHRRLGLCALLGEADAGAFGRHLGHAGAAYLSTLRKVRWDQVAAPYYLATSRNAPFFDALAAGHLPLARALADHSRAEWAPDDEYEDDFAFVRAVMALLGDGAAPSADADACLDRLARAAVPDDPRPATCLALRRGHADDFQEAFGQLVHAAQADADAKADDPAADPAELATEARLFVPGVALARLAALRGLSPGRRHRQVPAFAFTAIPEQGPAPDGWRAR